MTLCLTDWLSLKYWIPKKSDLPYQGLNSPTFDHMVTMRKDFCGNKLCEAIVFKWAQPILKCVKHMKESLRVNRVWFEKCEGEKKSHTKILDYSEFGEWLLSLGEKERLYLTFKKWQKIILWREKCLLHLLSNQKWVYYMLWLSCEWKAFIKLCFIVHNHWKSPIQRSFKV